MPNSCPPSDAVDAEIARAYRLVANNPPTANDFASKAQMGEVVTFGADPCKWASCSLFSKIKPLMKLTRLRAEYPHLMALSIPAGFGLHVANERTGHIDFWRYSGKCLSSVATLAQVPDDEP